MTVKIQRQVVMLTKLCVLISSIFLITGCSTNKYFEMSVSGKNIKCSMITRICSGDDMTFKLIRAAKYDPSQRTELKPMPDNPKL